MTNPEAVESSSSIPPPPKKRRRTAPTKKKKTTAAEASATKPRAQTPPPTHVLIIDNGGDTLKYGWADEENQEPKCLPNVTARLLHQFTVLVGDELTQVQNPHSLHSFTRSTERGIICDLGNQTQVWKRLLDQAGVIVPPNSEFGWKVKGGIAANNNAAASAAATKPARQIPAHAVAVLLLLPPHCPRVLLDQIFTVWMEDFGVSHVGLGISTVCAAKEHPTYHTSVVVDLGWSATQIVPTYNGKPVTPLAIRRMPIGGRHLINMFKYYMSYRQYNLMEQDHILRDVLEKLAYLSLDFQEDLLIARKVSSGRRPYDRDYVLPNYQTTFSGKVQLPLALERQQQQEEQAKAEGGEEDGDDDDDDEDDEDFNSDDGGDDNEDEGEGEENDSDEEETEEERRRQIMKQRAEQERQKREHVEEEQMLRVSVERFTIPEVIFRPFDAGLTPDLIGLSQSIIQSIQACPKPYHAPLYQSIFVTGGLSQLPNLQKRLEQELRTLTPTEYKLQITMSESPTNQAWLGARDWVRDIPYAQWSVNREEWEAASKRKAYTRLLVSNGGVYV
jgi:actin-related protein 6